MNVRREIDNYSEANDKVILNWLLDRYSMASRWSFVAVCRFERYGVLSYETNRVWTPTYEGVALYNYEHGIKHPSL